MPLIDLVSETLVTAAANPELRFDRIVAQADPALLGAGIAAALSELPADALAPTFEKLFVHSDALQQAALLNRLLAAAPETARMAAGGALGRLLAPGSSPGSALRGDGLELAPSIEGTPVPRPEYEHLELTSLQATALLPAEVGELAAAVVARAPAVLDEIGRVYAAYPTIVKTLGNPALLSILREMQRRLQAGAEGAAAARG